jgi:hypothetical protein
MGITLRWYGMIIEADMRTIIKERNSLEAEDTAAALATHIVREIERMFPTLSMGRSRLQKMFYLLSREGDVSFSFDLFMNGPYSDSVEGALGLAVESGMLTATKENGRSSISARGGISGEVPAELREKADQSIRAYGFYDEADLAILTTAFFLEDHNRLEPDDLVKAVLEVNPHFDPRRICSLLDRTNVVFRSW